MCGTETTRVNEYPYKFRRETSAHGPVDWNEDSADAASSAGAAVRRMRERRIGGRVRARRSALRLLRQLPPREPRVTNDSQLGGN